MHACLRLPAPWIRRLFYAVRVTTPLERPKTPASVAIIGSVIVVVVGFIILKMVIGFVITLAKLAFAVAVIVAVAVMLTRVLSKN